VITGAGRHGARRREVRGRRGHRGHQGHRGHGEQDHAGRSRAGQLPYL